MSENKLVQEALIQMKQVEEAIAENAKGILASTMKEEINQLVKESLSEQDDETEVDLDADIDMSADNDDVDIDDVDMTMDMDMDSDEDSDETPIDLTNASDEEILKVFKAMGENDGIIVKKDGDEIHLTDDDSDVEYLVKLGESMEDDSEIMEEDEYDMMDEEMYEEDETVNDVIDAIFSGNMSDMDEEIDDDMDEVVYEIEMDEDDDMDSDDEDMDEELTNETYKPKGVGIGSGPKFSYKDKAKGGFNEKKKQGPKSVGTGKAKFDYKKGENMEGKGKVVKAETKEGAHEMKKHDTLKNKPFGKEETKEAARTYAFGPKGLRKGITNNRNLKKESTQEEVSMLREKNEEYRKALNVFREKLNEVAIFNSNLAYATRLFTEHSTTKKEKINILRRFDNVDTLKESKNLYRSIKDELSKVETKSINESVGSKLNKTVSTGSSTTLIETKTYENPQLLRMKDLINKLG